MKVLLIVPSYNEEENVLDNYMRVIDYNKKNKTNFDIMIVNDGSTDKTEDICIKNNIPHISLIQNLGIGGAVQTGYKYAYENDYDIAVQFDGDGQHDISYVKTIIDPIINGDSDFVIGSRFIKKDKNNFNSTFSRRLGINLISFFIKLTTKKKIYDTTSGFRAVNKEIIKFFATDYPSEYPEPITTTQLLKQNYRYSEVPVKMNARMGGKSSIGSWKNVYYMVNVIISIITVDVRRKK